MEAPLPNNEIQRLQALLQYEVLDTTAEAAFDNLTLLAAHLCKTPIALVSLVDSARQWFKSKVGLNATETCREIAFCAHALLQTDVFVVPDALKDERFVNNPLVVTDPKIRFYAGVPLINPDGFALGTLCVIDYVPRQLSTQEREALKILAHQVMTQLELRRNLKVMTDTLHERQRAEAEIRKALEKEQELSELKSRFVSMTSHEFRTPLSTILSSAELLQHYQHSLTEEKKHKHLQRIQTAVHHMNQLLNDVGAIGRAEAGKQDFHPVPLDLGNFCRDLVEDLQLSLGSLHPVTFVEFKEHYPERLLQEKSTLDGSQKNSSSLSLQPATLCEPLPSMDEKLLRQIFTNLLSNAIKYSCPGSPVRFELRYQAGEAIFEIQDQGIGIPLEDQDHIFDSFHRATNVGTIPGTGLGLAIVKKNVDLHKGKITVHSEVGSGTKFRVVLPLDNFSDS
jgi:signal transduction histidine kinase